MLTQDHEQANKLGASLNLATFVDPLNQAFKQHPIETVEELQSTAEAQLARLQQQEEHIITVQSNLDLLLKRYHTEKGYFSRAAEWYGECAWWVKIMLGVVVVGLGAGLGAIFHAPISIAFASLAIYLLVSYLFINHHNVSARRHKRLCEDVIELEKSLKEAVLHFSALSNSLRHVMTTLCEMNVHMSENLGVLEGQLQTMQDKLATYQSIIQELSEAKDSVLANTSKINSKLNNAEQLYQTCHQSITDNASRLHHTNDGLGVVSIALSQDQVALHAINEKFHQESVVMSSYANQMQLIFQALKSRAAEHQQLHDKLKQSIHTTEISHEASEQVISNAEIALKKVTDQLASSNVIDLKGQQLSSEVENTIQTSRHRLAATDNLLEKLQFNLQVRTTFI